MVSFRLSDEEYDAVKNLCRSNGVRSLSGLARMAMVNLMAGDGSVAGEALSSRLEALTCRVHVLDLAVGRLTAIVRGSAKEQA